MPYCDSIIGKKLEVIVVNYNCLEPFINFCEYNKEDIIKNRLGDIVYSDSIINLDNQSYRFLNKILFPVHNIHQRREIFSLRPSFVNDEMNILYDSNNSVVPYSGSLKLVCSIIK